MFPAHTVVLLGDSRLEEKDALAKLKQYKAYQEERKNLFDIFGKLIPPMNSSNCENFEARTFKCKPCKYTTPSRSNWWRHKKTQKHKIMFSI